jgi:hypothetical protein
MTYRKREKEKIEFRFCVLYRVLSYFNLESVFEYCLFCIESTTVAVTFAKTTHDRLHVQTDLEKTLIIDKNNHLFTL